MAKDKEGNDLPVHDLVCGEAFGYSDLLDVVVSFFWVDVIFVGSRIPGRNSGAQRLRDDRVHLH